MGLIRYTTSVDSDVDYDPRQFAEEIAIYLADPEGWAQLHTFVVGKGKRIRLSSPHTLKKECQDDMLSCAMLGGNEIWLNSNRWIHGAAPSKLPLERYRQYMVSHEMGHSLGYDHVQCTSGPAPVMMQQTLGIGKCSPNTAVDLSQLPSKSSHRSQ